jgi:hypothetical protein
MDICLICLHATVRFRRLDTISSLSMQRYGYANGPMCPTEDRLSPTRHGFSTC